LAGTLRDVEASLGSLGGLDVATAATFEEARRAADRWQAGVPPRGSEGAAIVDRLESASLPLLEGDAETR